MKGLSPLSESDLAAVVGGGGLNDCEALIRKNVWNESPTRFPPDYVNCQVDTYCAARRAGKRLAYADVEAQKVCGLPPTPHDQRYMK